ncbi:putative Sphingoid long-chain base transporter RSB1 [Sclerotinia borealis F-4128]|uniref:Putative Sphingoid long-chain base transporter RSB1 n=1 Tax=Sclerotinia borealis (strain F-4128) TaxID=1432307 RepID=W9CHF1_SCLBF|nr:putative Sphingoid long-chain base transporter RSB1 [Sclerotinia borealis F-4128]
MNSLFTLLPRNQIDNYADCTVDLCPISTSYYFYRVSIGANATFLALFSISLLGFILTYAFTRRATAFTFAMCAGVILEVIGYIGRIMSWQNQWKQNGFLMQIVCLTIAPAFMAGGIYLCLRRIVYAFGPENSRISPEAYTRIFIPCDLISLLLQAAGGGLASAASHSNESPDIGDNIMVAGLAFQVLTLFIFMVLCVDFALRTRSRYRSLGSAAFDQNPAFITLRSSRAFKGFIAALALATICIFWRSVYRVAELAEGWTGHLIRQQNLFIGFEGVMVIVACFALNLFNPAITFKEAMTGLGGLGTKKKMKKQEESREKASEGISVSNSDIEAGKVASSV